MSLFRSESANGFTVAGLSGKGAAWQDFQRPNRWADLSIDVTAKATIQPPKTVVDLVHKRSAETAGRHGRLCWVVSSDLMPLWLQIPPQGLRSLQELQAVAQVRATQLMGGRTIGDEWIVSGDWHSHLAFLCAALPRSWHEALGVSAVVTSPLHLALSAIQWRQRPSGWFAISTPFEFHLLLRAEGAWRQLRSLKLTPGLADHALRDRILTQWQRESLKAGDSNTKLEWLHLAPIQPTGLQSSLRLLDPALGEHLATSVGDTTFQPDETASTAEARHSAWLGHKLMALLQA